MFLPVRTVPQPLTTLVNCVSDQISADHFQDCLSWLLTCIEPENSIHSSLRGIWRWINKDIHANERVSRQYLAHGRKDRSCWLIKVHAFSKVRKSKNQTFDRLFFSTSPAQKYCTLCSVLTWRIVRHVWSHDVTKDEQCTNQKVGKAVGQWQCAERHSLPGCVFPRGGLLRWKLEKRGPTLPSLDWFLQKIAQHSAVCNTVLLWR